MEKTVKQSTLPEDMKSDKSECAKYIPTCAKYIPTKEEKKRKRIFMIRHYAKKVGKYSAIAGGLFVISVAGSFTATKLPGLFAKFSKKK